MHFEPLGVSQESNHCFQLSSQISPWMALSLALQASRVCGRAVRRNVAAVKPSLLAVSLASCSKVYFFYIFVSIFMIYCMKAHK